MGATLLEGVLHVTVEPSVWSATSERLAKLRATGAHSGGADPWGQGPLSMLYIHTHAGHATNGLTLHERMST